MDLAGFSECPIGLCSPGELQVVGSIPPAPVWDSGRDWSERAPRGGPLLGVGDTSSGKLTEDGESFLQSSEV